MYNIEEPDPYIPEKYKNMNFKAHKKVRKTWEIDPVEKVVPNKKKALKIKDKHKKKWQEYDMEDFNYE